MARRHKSEQKVIDLIRDLSRAFTGTKTAKALSDLLVQGANRANASSFHVNRLNGFLDGVPNRSINEKTFNSILSRMKQIKVDDIEDINLQEEIRSHFNNNLSSGRPEKEALENTSTDLNVPLGVVTSLVGPTSSLVKKSSKVVPDWSWQQNAIDKCMSAIRQNKGKNNGLVIPTGGGKTRIAVQVICKLIQEGECKKIAWVAHRNFLLEQAKSEVERTAQELSYSKLEEKKLIDSFSFLMVGEVNNNFSKIEVEHDTVVVDEAHHAAAISYQKIVFSTKMTGLFLTATPNRMDGRPIGIDNICFQISPRQLFEFKCIIEPELAQFESKAFPSVFHNDVSVQEFARYILEKAKKDFNKSLICVFRVQEVEDLYNAIIQELPLMGGHHLLEEDVRYAHGSFNSGDGSLYKEFDEQSGGILIATSGLVSEGLDIPSLDSVYVTYQSNSISHLLQIAGRALRSDIAKEKATITQVKTNDLQYYFYTEWLYQDITDRLRPQITIMNYSDVHDLQSLIKVQLERYNVPEYDRSKVLAILKDLDPNESFRILFSGIRYFGKLEHFSTQARWHALLVRDDDDHFVPKFNEVCYAEIINDKPAYASQLVSQVSSITSEVSVDLVDAINRAKQEINHNEWDMDHRGKPNDYSTTWLHNISFKFSNPASKLDEFLTNCSNKDQVLREYEATSKNFVIKLSNPLRLNFAILLFAEEYSWLELYLVNLSAVLKEKAALQPWNVVSDFNQSLTGCPLPLWTLPRLTELLDYEARQEQMLSL